ncbi:MAG TPA: hypothetical protein PLW93_06055 [Candidatus Absconditabacterales bacterium]|nr:hypothetical protein [Candidatus Absconditabacterales bacterium]
MSTKLVYFLLAASLVVVVAGCTNPLSQDVSLSSSKTADTSVQKTGIDLCDRYLAVLHCLAEEQSGSTLGQQYTTTYENMITSWKDVPADQLQETCQSLTNNMLNNPETLSKSTCKL